MALDRELLREQFERRRQERLALESLVGSKGWQVVRLALEANTAGAQLEMQSSPNSMDGAFQKSYINGRIFGGKLMLNLPEILIENCKEDEADLQNKLNEPVEEGNG